MPRPVEERIAGLPPEALALLVRLTRLDADATQTGPVARPPGLTAPLSSAQERLWFLEQLQGGGGVYHIPVLLEYGSGLAVEPLERALNDVVARHEALRTRFVLEGGVPVQRVSPYLDVPLERFDLRGAADPEAEARALVAEGTVRAFDLERGPTLRAWLLQLGAEHYRLLVVLHHIVSDGWSIAIFVRELHAFYAAQAGGVAAKLEPLPIQYPDYALWQREQAATSALESHKRWWLDHLEGAPPLLDLPTDRPRPAVEGHAGATRLFAVPAPLAERLRGLARERGATLFMVLLTMFDALLARWSGSADLVVATPIAGRSRPDLEGLIGFFVNMLALRMRVAWDEPVAQLIDRVRAVSVAAFEHQALAFDQLVEVLQPERSLSFSPVYQVAFVLQNLPGEAAQGQVPGEGVSAPLPGSAKFDLTLSLSEAQDGLVGACEYRVDLFDHATIERLCRRYVAMLGAVVADPAQPVGQLPMRLAGEPATRPAGGDVAASLGLTAASRVAVAGEGMAALAAFVAAPTGPLATATHLVATPEALAGLSPDEVDAAVSIVVVGLPCFAAPLARWRGRRLLGLWAPDGVAVARLVLGAHEAAIDAAFAGHAIEVTDGGGAPEACDVVGALRLDGADTGFLARRRDDGTVLVEGRAARMVRLQGVRGDPERAAALLRQHPAVAQAGIAVTPAAGRREARIAAWVVPRPDTAITGEDLVAYAGANLAAGLAPGSITRLDAPPDAGWQGPVRETGPATPGTPLEALLARIWSDVLKQPQTDIDANFFDQGGNSVSSVQVIARIRDAARIDLPLHQLFEAPSIRDLAKLIQKQQHLALGPLSSAEETGDWTSDTYALGSDEIARFVDGLDEPAIDELLARLKEHAG